MQDGILQGSHEQMMEEYAKRYKKICIENNSIDGKLFDEFGVKRGLRDKNGKGVLSGITNISLIKATDMDGDRVIPCEGQLFYRGYNIYDLTKGFRQDNRFGFEETAYLLLFGELPAASQLKEFQDVLAKNRRLPTNFVRDVIMKAPSKDIMNSLTKSVLTLASYDDKVTDNSLENVLSQSIMLISVFPMLAVYGYHAYNHYECDESFYIHRPSDELSAAENILRMLRPNKEYTDVEAKVLDLALVLHMEHGGGNNSTFTNHVVTSSGTDTYSAVAASIASLKGPRHGGANLKVQQMFADLKKNVSDIKDDSQIEGYLKKVLKGEAFDGSGLIYGMGHAVYTISDPRELILKGFAEKLANEKGMQDEFLLHDTVERIAAELIMARRHVIKPVCANVDFYSGLIYTMLGIPEELFTPLFALSRISGWSAHRLEELVNKEKIIRPAYKYVGHHKEYVELEERK